MRTAELEREIAALHQRTNALEQDRAKVAERNVALERENKILRDQLAILKQGLFGRRSERIDPGQLALFLGGEAPVDAQATIAVEQITKPRERIEGHGRARFAEHLPREVIELDVPQAERVCPFCGKAMHGIGEEISERGHVVPARIVVRRYVRKKYACPDGHAVRTASAPEGVIDGAKYEASA